VYTHSVPSNAVISDFKIVYANDIGQTVNGIWQNRDLRVDSVQYQNITYTSNSPTTYSVGSSDSANGCGGGYKRSVWLNCNGYFQYNISTKASANSIQAEKFVSMGGTVAVAPQEKTPGVLVTPTYIYRFDPKDWVRYDGVNLSGKSRIDFYMSPRSQGGKLEIRNGSTTGALLGTLTTNSTDSTLTNYSLQSANIASVTSPVNLYLVGVNMYEIGRIDWFEAK
jgi:hypothetical protein